MKCSMCNREAKYPLLVCDEPLDYFCLIHAQQVQRLFENISREPDNSNKYKPVMSGRGMGKANEIKPFLGRGEHIHPRHESNEEKWETIMKIAGRD